MANEKNVFSRLKRLLGSNIVVRQTPDKRLLVKDLDFSQSALLSNFIDRYSRLTQTTVRGYGSKFGPKSPFEAARNELFRDFEQMDSDSILSSALDIYSDESTELILRVKFLQLKQTMKKYLKFFIICFMTY